MAVPNPFVVIEDLFVTLFSFLKSWTVKNFHRIILREIFI